MFNFAPIHIMLIIALTIVYKGVLMLLVMEIRTATTSLELVS